MWIILCLHIPVVLYRLYFNKEFFPKDKNDNLIYFNYCFRKINSMEELNTIVFEYENCLQGKCSVMKIGKNPYILDDTAMEEIMNIEKIINADFKKGEQVKIINNIWVDLTGIISKVFKDICFVEVLLFNRFIILKINKKCLQKI